MKLEWLYRLLLEPGRLWKRYMLFTPLLIAQALAERAGVL
jgi:UDP-N-acetyl-D-mannosaminuronic acid transferase (WecB/TagA/CpsF family)